MQGMSRDVKTSSRYLYRYMQKHIRSIAGHLKKEVAYIDTPGPTTFWIHEHNIEADSDSYM